jgi:transcriptional regulator with XRE-family HTH domain
MRVVDAKQQDIGRRLVKLRRGAGLNQEDLAAAVGVSRSLIATMEVGIYRGGIDTMVALADYFKVPLDWLMCRTVPPGGPMVGQFVELPNEIALLSFFRSLTPEERRFAVKLLRLPPFDCRRLEA